MKPNPNVMKAYRFAKEFMQTHTDKPYHNWRHAKDVVYRANRLAKKEGLNHRDRYIVMTAALVHDLIVDNGSKYNEEVSAAIAEEILPKFGYTGNHAYYVGALVRGTKLPTNPQDKLEQVICDADIDNLGREDFFERAEEVRVEVGADSGNGWYKGLLGFVKTQKFYTPTAKETRNEKLQENIRKLEKLVEAA